MKAAVYNPYFDTLGGGERYTAAFVKVLLDEGYKVDIEWRDPDLKEKLLGRFGIDLQGATIVGDIKRGDGYDLCFWLSDGSIPILRSRNNIIHFQFPFKNVSGKSLLNKMKLFRVNNIVCNSAFTKKIIDSEFRINSKVLYPPVEIQSTSKLKKENIILYVGRFSDLTQLKRQDILIQNFKKVSKNNNSWRLILAGGVEIGADNLIPKLESMIGKYPITIIKSPSYQELVDHYKRAKIFWSASGYGINEDITPTKVEHFGMSLVEAMITGSCPVVYGAGGHKEIIDSGINGFLWHKESELVSITNKLISDHNLLKNIAENASVKAKKYSYDVFKSDILKLI